MTLQVMHDNDILITSQQDANLYFGLGNNQKHYINKGIGNNFEVVTSGLQATLKKGQGAIYGRHITNDEDVSITLPANNSFYLVLRFDRTQSKGNELQFKAVTILQNEDISNGGKVFDMPLYRVVTTTSNATKTDIRIYKDINNVSLQGIEYVDSVRTFSDFCNEVKRLIPVNSLLIDTVNTSNFPNLVNTLKSETGTASGVYMIEFIASSTRTYGSKIVVRDAARNEYVDIIGNGTEWKLKIVDYVFDWKKISLTTNFKNYANNINNQPEYKRVGDVIFLRGELSPAKVLTGSSGEVVILTLPEGFRPSKREIFICQGSAMNRWTLTVNPNGDVSFSRYGVASYIDAPTDAWLPFNCSFTI